MKNINPLLCMILFGFISSGVYATELKTHPLGLGNSTNTDTLEHIPSYMPNFPTAATIWPRVVQIPCKMVDSKLVCDGYSWRPEYGRGEYLFVEPVINEEKPCNVINNIVNEEIVSPSIVEKLTENKPPKRAKPKKPSKSRQCK